MYSQGPPKRFSHQVQQLKFRRGLAAAPGVEGRANDPGELRTRTKSAPNVKGKFNVDLERTGFLGETKMRDKRIAANPKRFLEAYADRRGDPSTELEFVPTELPELEHFIEQLALENRFEQKEAAMKKRTESAKHRTFLLALTSTSTMEVDPKTLAFLQSWSGVEGDNITDNKNKMYEDAQGMESLVTNYLDRIHNLDTTAIQAWVTEFLDLPDLELPYGLPTNASVCEEFEDSREITSFMEAAQDNFLLLDGAFHTKVDEVTNELKTVVNLIEESWTKEESSLLFYVMNSFTSGGAESSAILPLQLELMRRLFPGKGQSEITKQKFRLKLKKTLEEKRTSVIRAWMRDKSELQFKMDVAWREVSKKRQAELERKLSIKKQKDICDFWAERLQKMRLEKCEQVKKVKILVEPVEKYRENQTKSIAESEAQRREAAKADLRKYQLQKQNESDVVAIRMQMERALEEAATKERLARNKHRVALRANQRKAKDKAKQELESAIEEHRQQRQILLNQTKHSVEIDYDPASVVADTHASMVRRVITLKDQKRTEDERMANVFRDCYSFSADTVMKDRRLRFETKLKEAGLQGSDYARQILLAMEPKPKPHLESHVKLSHDDPSGQ